MTNNTIENCKHNCQVSGLNLSKDVQLNNLLLLIELDFTSYLVIF